MTSPKPSKICKNCGKLCWGKQCRKCFETKIGLTVCRMYGNKRKREEKNELCDLVGEQLKKRAE